VKIIIVFLFLFIVGCATQKSSQEAAIKAGYKVLYSSDVGTTIVEDSSGNIVLLKHSLADENSTIKEVMILKKFPCSETEKKESW
jgi:hypothetical protein